MSFELKDLLEAVGPTASLIFAAWIFLSFLQQRYLSAYERYRDLIEEFRAMHAGDSRRDNIGSQAMMYRARCEQMRLATTIGLVSATLLITVLLCGIANVVWPDASWIKFVGAVCATLGLLLVMVSASLVIRENHALRQTMEDELRQVPELHRRVQASGSRHGLTGVSQR